MVSLTLDLECGEAGIPAYPAVESVKRTTTNMIRHDLGASVVDFYTDFNIVVMVMALFDCSSQYYDVTIRTRHNALTCKQRQ